MKYHYAVKLKNYDELLIKLNDSNLTKYYLYLLHKNYQRQPPLLRDQGAYTLEKMQTLAKQCKNVLGWNWTNLDYSDIAITTQMHKDIETYLSTGFSNVPAEHDHLLHELHICLHSIQRNNKRTTIQFEWFNDDGFSLKDYDFTFSHDGTLGAICLQNPYVGHPPDWVCEQNDYTNVWQTCKFHDFVRPGFVIQMTGSIEKTINSFNVSNYVKWWKTHALDFFEFHGEQKMITNTGKPVIGYVVNNDLLLTMQHQSLLELEYIRFNPEIDISPAQQVFLPDCKIGQHDYNNIAGPDWPPYDQFVTGQNIPSFVVKEIEELTGIQI
jgi:hypothetical protein